MRSEFAIIPYADFVKKLGNSESFKNRFYTVVIFRKASGSIVIDGKIHEVTDGKIFFINYDQVYTVGETNAETAEVILFSKSFYNYIYTGNKAIRSDTALTQVAPFITQNAEKTADILSVFNELKTEFEKKNLLKKEIICLLLKVFMLKYIRNSNRKNVVRKSHKHKEYIVQEFTELVNQHYKELKTTAQYAEKLNITPNYLNSIIKKHLFIPATQVIKNRVILEAERLLLHTNLSVVEISYELGFADNSHFGKYFKAARSYSPEQYRKKFATELQ